MDEIPCITCANSLREHGKMSPDMQFAFCSLCHAVYSVVPVIDEDGKPRVTSQGDIAFYLNPIKPGSPAFAKDEHEVVNPKADFSEFLEKIKKANTPNDLLA